MWKILSVSIIHSWQIGWLNKIVLIFFNAIITPGWGENEMNHDVTHRKCSYERKSVRDSVLINEEKMSENKVNNI